MYKEIAPIPVPPSSSTIFQPVTTCWKDNLTYIEFLLGLLKKLNEVVEATNANSEWINSYAGRIEEIEAQVAALYKDFEQFKTDVNNSITTQFNQIKVELEAQIQSAIQYLQAYTDAKAEELHQEIIAVSTGTITVFNPVIGEEDSLQNTINSLFDQGRDNAITAQEYDSLELTATAYDDYEITAADFDYNAKKLLMATT